MVVRARRDASARRDAGFTLIELLVVVIIVGVLAGVAVPTYLNQRKKAVDAAMKSELRNAGTKVEDWVAANPTLALGPDHRITDGNGQVTATGTGPLYGMHFGPDRYVTMIVSASDPGAYCVFIYSPRASRATTGSSRLAYFSAAGGLQPSTVSSTACA